MKSPTNDIQSTSPKHKIAISKVGVRNMKFPFSIITKDNSIFHTIATISSYCELNEETKGINMSRISRSINKVLNEEKEGFISLVNFIKELRLMHGTENVSIKAKFDYLYKVKSPIEEQASIQPVKVEVESIGVNNGDILTHLTITSTEMSLCPCSKDMSLLINNISKSQLLLLEQIEDENLKSKIFNAGFGAHNQKSEIKVKVTLNSNSGSIFWIEDLVEIIKRGSSCPTFSTLKRWDEKWVTEVSYMGGYYDQNNNFIEVEDSGPKFVEDISRDIASNLNKVLDDKIIDYCVVVNNQESIHSEDIVATAILHCGRNLN